MHSHTTRAQAARPAVSAAAVRQRRLRRACRLVLGRVLALSRAPVVLARRLPRPLTLGLKALARAVEVLVARLRPRPRRARTLLSLSRIDGFTVRRLSGYGRHSLIACGGANKLLYSLKDQIRIMHSHTTRTLSLSSTCCLLRQQTPLRDITR